MNNIISILLSFVIASSSALILSDNDKIIEIESIPLQAILTATQAEDDKIKDYMQATNILMNCQMDIIEEKIQQMQQELTEIESIEDRQEWFLAYKDIIFKYVKWFGMPQTIFDAYTEEEITLICRVVETECYDQDFMSKCNVASVILNRVEQGGEFGGSVTEVITKKNQFAYYREDITQDTILSIMYVYEIGDTTDGCIAFRSDRSPETWYGWKRMFADDAGHHYYKKMEDQNE